MARWAVDLGTCNTGVCRWDEGTGKPVFVPLPGICRAPDGDDALLAPHMIPTATHLVTDWDLWTRLGAAPWLSRHVLWGRQAWIGQQAIERNLASPTAAFVPSFKGWLGRASHAPLARLHGDAWSARDVARIFLRELIAEVERVTGERIRDLLVTVPVDTFESYRAELASILRGLGVTRVRFADEPVAAAIGYGLGLSARRRVLVADFGAGTFNLALVEMRARDTELGHADVIAKAGRTTGGDHVDAWLLDAILDALGSPHATDDVFWRRQLLDEARRVKELSYSRGREAFRLIPPDRLADVQRGLLRAPELVVDQDFVRGVLEARGVLRMLDACLDEVLDQARARGLSHDDIDDVLMVGGSTLLPGVYPLFEARFGRPRVRAWRPFEAVVWGGAAIAADALTESDFLVHDYAILTWDPTTGEAVHVPIVERGARFPTRPDHWHRQLVPTCALGEPESVFKLVICELGGASEDERLFGWDAHGRVHTLTSGETRLIVPLNEGAPALGTLDPPHAPGDRTPRLDVCFGVDADRWLVATVKDLATGKTLMDAAPVVRLL